MKKIHIYILIIIFLFFLVITSSVVIYNNSNDNILISRNFSYELKATTSIPIMLKIPKINLESKIDPVGVTKKGDMDVPKSLANVGWYKFGVAPGEKGSAVLDGHLIDNIRNQPLVFSRLDELVVGDDIYVLNENGEDLHFRVIDKKVFDYNLKDTSAIFAPATTSKLNLITCDGDWIQSVKSYNKRLVIFAEMVI